MPKRLQRLNITPGIDPRLQCANEKIAHCAALKPWKDIYRSFSMAAQLAGAAIEAAQELQEMPGTIAGPLQPTLAFWYRVRDYNHAAALAVAGGNQTLAEALVTFRMLQGFDFPDPSASRKKAERILRP